MKLRELAVHLPREANVQDSFANIEIASPNASPIPIARQDVKPSQIEIEKQDDVEEYDAFAAEIQDTIQNINSTVRLLQEQNQSNADALRRLENALASQTRSTPQIGLADLDSKALLFAFAWPIIAFALLRPH